MRNIGTKSHLRTAGCRGLGRDGGWRRDGTTRVDRWPWRRGRRTGGSLHRRPIRSFECRPRHEKGRNAHQGSCDSQDRSPSDPTVAPHGGGRAEHGAAQEPGRDECEGSEFSGAPLALDIRVVQSTACAIAVIDPNGGDPRSQRQEKASEKYRPRPSGQWVRRGGSSSCVTSATAAGPGLT